MKVMRQEAALAPLVARDLATPAVAGHAVRIAVAACGVCRTDLHVVDDELPDVPRPVIPGHEVVGRVVEAGPEARFAPGDRVGVPWLGWTCGSCEFCRGGLENLCPEARFTGYTLDGGYADTITADSRYCLPIPARYTDEAAAPLLCAGLIGYRCLKLAGGGRDIGLYGFGAAAHIVAQIARFQDRRVHAFVRPGDDRAATFARELGAVWAGPSDAPPPDPLDAAIIFAPVGALVPLALKAVKPGGSVVCGGIHMSDIPSFPYADLWRERTIRSVANLTRADGAEFMDLAGRFDIETHTHIYPLANANQALDDLRAGRFSGAAVLVP